MRNAEFEAKYRFRTSRSWRARALRILQSPLPLIANPDEPRGFPLGRWNLYVGGAGAVTPGYVNLDIVLVPGVDIVADAERLPFRSGVFQMVECDAVLEHVRRPEAVVAEIGRVMAAGGYVHLVTPFCHPFHEYPADYRRFTPDGLRELTGSMEVVAEGWRTGPTATLLVVFTEYVKMLMPWRVWRAAVHFVLGWLLFPLRYADLLLFRSPRAMRIGNHCYMWLRKR